MSNRVLVKQLEPPNCKYCEVLSIRSVAYIPRKPCWLEPFCEMEKENAFVILLCSSCRQWLDLGKADSGAEEKGADIQQQ